MGAICGQSPDGGDIPRQPDAGSTPAASTRILALCATPAWRDRFAHREQINPRLVVPLLRFDQLQGLHPGPDQPRIVKAFGAPPSAYPRFWVELEWEIQVRELKVELVDLD